MESSTTTPQVRRVTATTIAEAFRETVAQRPDAVAIRTRGEGVGASGEGFDGDAAAERVKPEDILTLIYTSGTTGPPKGVQLVHGNIIAAVEGIEELVHFPEDGRVISWLPAAHVAERNAHH